MKDGKDYFGAIDSRRLEEISDLIESGLVQAERYPGPYGDGRRSVVLVDLWRGRSPSASERKKLEQAFPRFGSSEVRQP